MGQKLNLDRALTVDICYPIGVKEQITIVNNDANFTDTYQILIAKTNGDLVDTIEEADTPLTKAGNTITWDINYERGGLLKEDNYKWELRNKTEDYREFKGILTVTDTINHG